MNKKNNAGFSLVEIVVTVAILAILYTTVSTSLVWATKTNNRTTELLQAQLAVSSAVETLMAEGIDKETAKNNLPYYDEKNVNINTIEDRFPGIKVVTKTVKIEGTVDKYHPYYEVTVSTDDDSVIVTTYIREKKPASTQPPAEMGGVTP